MFLLRRSTALYSQQLEFFIFGSQIGTRKRVWLHSLECLSICGREFQGAHVWGLYSEWSFFFFSYVTLLLHKCSAGTVIRIMGNICSCLCKPQGQYSYWPLMNLQNEYNINIVWTTKTWESFVVTESVFRKSYRTQTH